MSSTSRRLSQRGKTSRNSHTPGKDKGGYCVRNPDAMIAINTNPYKGQGLKGQTKARYNRFWNKMFAVNGVKKQDQSN